MNFPALFAQAPAAAEGDIRPARGKIEIPVPEVFDRTPWLITAAVALVLLILILWLRRRKTKSRPLPPVERAVQALNAIDRERNNIPAGPLADQSAGVVRQFIAERFGIAAPRRTSEEFLRTLMAQTSSPLSAHTERLREFLHSCDLAKFAGTDFDASERLKLLETAFDFVRAADAAPPESPPAAAASPS